MYKKDNGITIIALIITIIIMLILVGVSFKFGTDAVDKARLEDIRTNMLSIKTKAKTIEEKYIFGDINSLAGETMPDEITLPEKLNEELKDKSNVYKWARETLDIQDLSNIKADDNNFYIVYYDTKKSTCEVYYSAGYKTKDGSIVYSLTEMQKI